MEEHGEKWTVLPMPVCTYVSKEKKYEQKHETNPALNADNGSAEELPNARSM